MTKIKFFIFVFFLFIPEFVYSNDNLANFIIRDYSEGELPIVGNPDAKYTIVEFFDYRCGYCSKQANDLAKLLEEKNNVKIIYLEFPIFGGISDTVARVALSIWNSNPELYFDVHNKFMNLGPRMKKDNIIDTLNELKLNGELIFAEAEKDIDNKIILKNRSLAQSLNLRGTPALIINDNLSPGYIKYEKMQLYYNAADLVISVPSSDSSPKSVYEAMFCGKPVIISDLPWSYELLEELDCVLRVDVKNPVQLAQAIKSLIDDNELLQALSKNSLLLAHKFFDYDINMKKMEAIMLSTLDRINN